MPTELEIRKEQKRFLMTLMKLRMSLDNGSVNLDDLDNVILEYSTEMLEEDVAIVEKNILKLKKS